MKTLVYTLLAGMVLFTSVESFAQAFPRTANCIRHSRETRTVPAVQNKVLAMGNYTSLFGTWEKRVMGKHLTIFITQNANTFVLQLTESGKRWKPLTFQVCDVPKKARTLQLLLDRSPFNSGDKDIVITMGSDGLLDVKLDWIQRLNDVPRTRL